MDYLDGFKAKLIVENKMLKKSVKILNGMVKILVIMMLLLFVINDLHYNEMQIFYWWEETNDDAKSLGFDIESFYL